MLVKIKKKLVYFDKIIFNSYFYNLYIKLIYRLRIFFIFKNKVVYKVGSEKNENLFGKLCNKHKSDKGYNYNLLENLELSPHSYDLFYNYYFYKIRNQINNVFELGIGSNNENIKSNMRNFTKPGSSLKVFREYFSKANIYGADIDKDILFNEERIKTYYVDSLNNLSIKKMWEKIKINEFDIIIDDGLHTYESNINFFNESFSKLKNGGFYIIEDIHFKYLSKLCNIFKNLKYNYKIIIFDYDRYFKKDSHIIVIIK